MKLEILPLYWPSSLCQQPHHTPVMIFSLTAQPRVWYCFITSQLVLIRPSATCRLRGLPGRRQSWWAAGRHWVNEGWWSAWASPPPRPICTTWLSAATRGAAQEEQTDTDLYSVLRCEQPEAASLLLLLVSTKTLSQMLELSGWIWLRVFQIESDVLTIMSHTHSRKESPHSKQFPVI